MRILARIFDTLVLFALAASMAMMLQPWWADGLRYGFFGAIGAIVLHNISSRMVNRA